MIANIPFVPNFPPQETWATTICWAGIYLLYSCPLAAMSKLALCPLRSTARQPTSTLKLVIHCSGGPGGLVGGGLE